MFLKCPFFFKSFFNIEVMYLCHVTFHAVLFVIIDITKCPMFSFSRLVRFNEYICHVVHVTFLIANRIFSGFRSCTKKNHLFKRVCFLVDKGQRNKHHSEFSESMIQLLEITKRPPEEDWCLSEAMRNVCSSRIFPIRSVLREAHIFSSCVYFYGSDSSKLMNYGKHYRWKMGEFTCEITWKHITDAYRAEIYIYDSCSGIYLISIQFMCTRMLLIRLFTLC